MTHFFVDWFVLGPRIGRKVNQVSSKHFLLAWLETCGITWVGRGLWGLFSAFLQCCYFPDATFHKLQGLREDINPS